ncbi:MAG: SPFH domain-containing protein [Solirubrobacterales bacterium]|nr:SPFH domain-containing protein [Solirubrobacterales bacterium]MBV9945006.1 SPFH domain-containing protein [Solirubrobacterales bacterium]
MDVISNPDVANQAVEPGLSASGQAHEQRAAWVIPGLPTMVGALAALALGIALTATAGSNSGPIVLGIIVICVAGLSFGGFFVVPPNQARVLILFGRYIGSVTQAGWWWCNPFAKKQKVSLRVRNFQSERVKVNDASGNPIEIAAVVVWRIVDTARAVFDVAEYEQFVTVQSETSLRHLASEYPYDDYKQDAISLRANADEVRGSLQAELQSRLRLAGIEILETRLTHLAYAPEIAEVMLRRQQAEAILAARKTMVQGAVSLVQMAVAQLADSDLIELDPERKATMVSNLMVVLSGDHSPTPVINTGSLYT